MLHVHVNASEKITKMCYITLPLHANPVTDSQLMYITRHPSMLTLPMLTLPTPQSATHHTSQIGQPIIATIDTAAAVRPPPHNTNNMAPLESSTGTCILLLQPCLHSHGQSTSPTKHCSAVAGHCLLWQTHRAQAAGACATKLVP
jgi:hypothetical protein